MDDKGTLVRVGVVSNVNQADKTAKVYYPDMSNMVSDWLQVLQHPHTTSNVSLHSHSAGTWMPKVNDKVVVLMQHGFNAKGFILGVLP